MPTFLFATLLAILCVSQPAPTCATSFALARRQPSPTLSTHWKSLGAVYASTGALQCPEWGFHVAGSHPPFSIDAVLAPYEAESAVVLQHVANVTGTTSRWIAWDANLPVGTPFAFRTTDSEGHVAWSEARWIQAATPAVCPRVRSFPFLSILLTLRPASRPRKDSTAPLPFWKETLLILQSFLLTLLKTYLCFEAFCSIFSRVLRWFPALVEEGARARDLTMGEVVLEDNCGRATVITARNRQQHDQDGGWAEWEDVATTLAGDIDL
ncbi:hypothetical protein JCM10207_007885 [Rhodosporidiobolus poonsookiae]